MYRRNSGTAALIIGVHVDVVITDGDDITAFKEQMHKLLDMSDLGLLRYYLGIEVKQAAGTITLCQSTYAGKILEGCNARRWKIG